MKNRIFTWLACASLLVYYTHSAAQSVEVHNINVGHGDATLIIVRDTAVLAGKLRAAGFSVPTERLLLLDSAIFHRIPLRNTVKKAVLIDVGDGDRQGQKVVRYCQSMGIAPGDTLEAFILTHNHKDHFGGFKSLMEAGGYDTPVYYRGNSRPVTTGVVFRRNFLQVCDDYSLTLIDADVTGTELDLGTVGTNAIKLRAVSSNGYVYKSIPPSDQILSNSQNDYGCSWLLQFGAFRYFIGGDLSGTTISAYKDVETPLVDSLVKYDRSVFANTTNTELLRKGHICAFKVDHHGSKHSTNPWFLYHTSPTAVFVSCGAKHGHPNLEVIENFSSPLPYDSLGHATTTAPTPNSLKNWFFTSLKSGWGDDRDSIGQPVSKGVIGGNITLIVDDSQILQKSRFAVRWDGELDIDMVGSDPAYLGRMRVPNTQSMKIYECHTARNVSYFP